MTNDPNLTDRVRDALIAEESLREVSMFGGLSFMVNDKMVVNVRNNGDLLVRVAPERAPELLMRPGAAQAEMGHGRRMGDGWISVTAASVESSPQLDEWLDVAMQYNACSPPARPKSRRPRRNV
ncbi:hypothetical protein EK0264_00310 [Epidermidibacterium keratini]|uniref:TfoX N-terminal domain-containing protein n=1 Tax=Epidermidibacterium keratini TaxID=1891644 RepID=A0A7M3T534_9ACTN|nr:TfoX/Sxy family protein [Epidermidibacterium keratini]QHB98895.1 hypothetical protein EK0264_00310 [Epidermidibacterium keratini]